MSMVAPVAWHGHEMLYGFGSAVIAGFLLTAVQNWTGQRTLFGPPLAALWSLWLLGRVGLLLPGLPAIGVAGVDLAFLPLLAGMLFRHIHLAKQRHNLIFPLLLLLLAGANLLIHLEWLGILADTAHSGLYLATYAEVLILIWMGGRVIPSFTSNRLRQPVQQWPWLELSLPGLTVLTLGVAWLWPQSILTGILAGLASGAHGLRWLGWYQSGYWHIPLLWVLHLGYLWLVLGLGLLSLAAFGQVPSSVALHAFTTGGIGILALGMMARVALGHTGRPLEASPMMALAFGLLNLAAVLRVLVPWFWPAFHLPALVGAGVLWLLAFALFTGRYLPILLQPRIDGRPG